MILDALVAKVSSYICAHPNERDCWQKAPALSGLMAWDQSEYRPFVQRQVKRIAATQKSDGNLSYGDWHTSSGGHIRTFTPLASETSAVGVPLVEMYGRTQNARLLEAARKQYQSLLDAPRTKAGGIWSRGEGPELWIDFTYLMCPFMVKFGLATQNNDAIDLAFDQVLVHVDALVDPRKHLARHAWCEQPDHFPQSAFWARGNGWLLCACAELLVLAPQHRHAGQIRRILNDVMQAMAAMQDASGYFYHVLDDPLSNLEASATLMFAYAAALTVQHDLLEPGHDANALMDRALRAFTVVAGAVEDSGKVPGVAMVPGGPGVAFDWTLFGQGFFLLAAHALRDQLDDAAFEEVM